MSAQEASKNTALEEQKDADHPQSCNTDNDNNTSGAATLGNQDRDDSDLLIKSEKDAASVNRSDSQEPLSPLITKERKKDDTSPFAIQKDDSKKDTSSD